MPRQRRLPPPHPPPPPAGLLVALTALSESDAFPAPVCAVGVGSRVPLASGNNDNRGGGVGGGGGLRAARADALRVGGYGGGGETGVKNWRAAPAGRLPAGSASFRTPARTSVDEEWRRCHHVVSVKAGFFVFFFPPPSPSALPPSSVLADVLI